MIPFWLHQGAFGLQLLALALFLAFMARPGRRLSLAATAVLTLACLLQLAFTIGLAVQHRAVPLGNPFEALNFWALIFTLLILLLEWRTRMGLLGAFLVPMSALLLLMGYRFDSVAGAGEGARPYGGVFLLAHVGLPMMGYALFTASAALAIAFLVEERQLKRGRLSGISYELPSLEALERMVTLTVLAGFAALSLGLLFGLLRSPRVFFERAGGDAKVAMSLLTFGFYGSCLLLRKGGLRGRRFALLLLLGFLALFFGFYLVNIYWGGHAMLEGRS